MTTFSNAGQARVRQSRTGGYCRSRQMTSGSQNVILVLAWHRFLSLDRYLAMKVLIIVSAALVASGCSPQQEPLVVADGAASAKSTPNTVDDDHAPGAAAGAVPGELIGIAEEQTEETNAAVGLARYAQIRELAIARAVTESDVVTMTRHGINDDVIINSLQTRGCRWDRTPDAVIRLKHGGVSDQVITAMQHTELKTAPSADGVE